MFEKRMYIIIMAVKKSIPGILKPQVIRLRWIPGYIRTIRNNISFIVFGAFNPSSFIALLLSVIEFKPTSVVPYSFFGSAV